jgi:Zn-dependent M16 (insulinase) family peptidase
MTTYNLLIIDKAIQHHYESTAVICPSQEEVENALQAVTIELQDLKEQNAELLLTLNAIRNMLKGGRVLNEMQMSEILNKINTLVLGTINRLERHIR